MSIWDEAATKLEAWAWFCAVLLWDITDHLTAFETAMLIEEISSIGARIRGKAHFQTAFPAALLHLIQTESNESICQVLYRRNRVICTNFDQLW